MKKKKALLALIMAATVVLVGGLAAMALQYFSQAVIGSDAGGDLSIDYYVTEAKEDEKAEERQSSQNVFQWLIDKLAEDKEKTVIVVPTEEVSGEQTISGMSQNRQDKETDEEMPEVTAPIENPALAPQKNDKKPDVSEDEEPDQEASVQDSNNETDKPNKDEPKETQNEDQKLVTISIRCDTAVEKGMNLEAKWAGIVPSSGTILQATTMEFQSGDTVFDVLCRVRDTYKIQVEYSGTNGAQYIEGINNLYEFDGGRWSGWMYCVNDWYPNYGCGQYAVKNGDVIEWNYTCNLGKDLGHQMASDEWMDANE